MSKLLNRAMESMRSTQKRKQGDEDKDAENVPKPKIKRRNGGDTVAYLREKTSRRIPGHIRELMAHGSRRLNILNI